MGHYDDCYEAEYERQRKAEAARLAAAKKKYPNTPSEWGISLEERVKMLEDQMNTLVGRLGK
jgi:hypothetical protein